MWKVTPGVERPPDSLGHKGEAMLQLWLIERNDHVDYDEHDSAIIRAGSEAAARLIAEEILYPRRKGIWQAKSTECKALTDDGTMGIVLASFRAG